MSEALAAEAPAPAALKTRSGGARTALSRGLASLNDALLQAFRSLAAHRLRSTLTIAGITMGIGLFIAAIAAMAGLNRMIANQLISLGPTTLYVSSRSWGPDGGQWWKTRNRPAVGRGDLRALEANALLPLAIAPVAGTNATVAIGQKELKNVGVRGTTEAFLETNGWTLKRGRFLSQIDQETGSDACVVGADIEDSFAGKDAVGQSMRVGTFTRCTVVGTLARKGSAFGQSQDAVVLLPLTSFQRGFGQKRGLTLAVKSAPDKMAETEDEVIQVIRRGRRLQVGEPDNFSVNRQDKLLSSFNQLTAGVEGIAVIVGGITLLVGGIGIMNILLVTVKERTREIGVRRALGARKTAILIQFLLEAVVVSLIGGVFGTLIGIGLANVLSLFMPLAGGIPMVAVAWGLGSTATVGLLSGIWPAWSAASLRPIEALRHE